MEYGGGMNELPYPSDLTAAQWALIPAPKPKGRKRRVAPRGKMGRRDVENVTAGKLADLKEKCS